MECLVNAAKLIVQFFADKCAIQDLSSKRTVGEAQQSGNLYHLVNPLTSLHTIETDSAQAWHRRLGHASNEVLDHLEFDFKFECKLCDCCHMAKQHRLPFYKSSVVTDFPFEILHMCGPYKIPSL